MLRGIFEKIPSFIIKTDVSNPQVNHHFIRPFSKVKRSCSCIDESLSTKISKFPLTGQEDSNRQRKESINVVQAKSAASNISFYKNPSRDSSNNPQYINHRSRFNIDDEVVREYKTYERYQLEAARPRKSRSELSFNDSNEFDFTKNGEALQPRNLKPFQSMEEDENSLPPLPNRFKHYTIDESSDINFEGDKKLTSDCLHQSYDLNARDIQNTEYTSSSSYMTRPSYSEYINSERATTDQKLRNKILLNKQDVYVAHKRSFSNFPNVTEDNSKPVCEKEANKELKDVKDSIENTPIQITVGKSVKKASITSKSSLKRLYIKSGQPIPCYSDFVKTKPIKPTITHPTEVPQKLDNLSVVPSRPLLTQNNTEASQKRDFSSLHNRKNSYKDSDYLPPKNSSNNYRPSSSEAASTLLSSKSARSVSIISSRTYVLCPAYSDYLKISSKKETKDMEPNKELLASKSVNFLNKHPLSTKKSTGNIFVSPTVKSIASLNESLQRRSEAHFSSHRLGENNRSGLSVYENQLLSSKRKDNKPVLKIDTKQYSSKKKKCKPKKDPCEPEKPKKCFLPSKVRLAPNIKCSPKFVPCPIEKKCPPRADDCICVKPKKLPSIQPVGCICIEPYIPERAPALKRLKFVAPDPPRICPEPYCPQPRADDSLVVRPKMLRPHKPKPCDCIEPPPLVDVPLIRLKKICEPERICYPPKPCPPPPPCIRADDDLCVKPKKLPILTAPICPCIEESVKDAPPLKRLNLKSPEPPRICPKPCVCHVDCPRADDGLIPRVKHLPPIKAGDCPCVDTEIVDVEFRRLKCIEDPEECVYTDPCDVPQPRADFGCWEYYTPEPEKICREIVIKTKKPCKKVKKVKIKRY